MRKTIPFYCINPISLVYLRIALHYFRFKRFLIRWFHCWYNYEILKESQRCWNRFIIPCNFGRDTVTWCGHYWEILASASTKHSCNGRINPSHSKHFRPDACILLLCIDCRLDHLWEIWLNKRRGFLLWGGFVWHPKLNLSSCFWFDKFGLHDFGNLPNVYGWGRPQGYFIWSLLSRFRVIRNCLANHIGHSIQKVLQILVFLSELLD